MNRFTRLIKENLLPFVVFVIIVVLCCGAWFFFHPSSPYHERYVFVVSFQKVGTLSPGNAVSIRGIKCGQITKVELTDDAVYVTAEVLATSQIPDNSEFRLINSGLMGEREMNVLSGDSPRLISNGDTLFGVFDEGMTGVGQKLTAILDGAGEIRDTLSALMDSISEGAAGKKIDRVSHKADRLVKLTKGNVREWKSEVQSLLDKCDRSLESAQAALDGVSSRAGSKLAEVDNLVDRTRELLSRVGVLKDQSEKIMQKLAKGDNSAGLLLQQDSPINKALDKLLLDVDSLLNDIKKNGLDINIDIF